MPSPVVEEADYIPYEDAVSSDGEVPRCDDMQQQMAEMRREMAAMHNLVHVMASTTAQPIVGSTTEFLERVGAADSLPPDASELAYFMLLFTLDIITRLVHETNLYAEQCQAARGVRNSAWQPTTVEEMRAYIGVNILMGFHQLPEIDHYWSSDDMLGVHAQ